MNIPPKIAYLDGHRIKAIVMAGATGVIQKQAYLDAINVFPVPDKDTGTNMGSTMKAILEDLHSFSSPLAEAVIGQVADSALLGARGNSGAILAQFFSGLNEGLQGLSKVQLSHWSKALQLANLRAREILLNPVEGTIITVIAAWSDFFHQLPSHQHTDFYSLFQQSLTPVYQALAQSKSSANGQEVVDAGAQGFVYFLEGISFLMQQRTRELRKQGGILLNSPLPQPGPEHEEHSSHSHDESCAENMPYRFCTECLLAAEDRPLLERAEILPLLSTFGDSLIVAGNKRKMRLHIHTNDPESFFMKVRDLGKTSHEKVDDMIQQFRDARNKLQKNPQVALVVDSACDLSKELMEKYNIHMVPVKVMFGEEAYLDKVTLKAQNFYVKLQNSPDHPKTSQPSPHDFKRCYEMVSKNYSATISLHIPEKLSGTFQLAKTVAKQVSSSIAVVDSRAASCGMGLLAVEAGKAIENGLSLPQILEQLEENRKNLKMFLTLDTLEYLVKGGRIHKVKGLIGNFLRLKPILTMNMDGTLEAVTQTMGGKAAQKKMLQLIQNEAKGCTQIHFGLAHANAPELAETYVQKLKTLFPQSSIFVTQMSPALGVHGGTGGLCLAMLRSPAI